MKQIAEKISEKLGVFSRAFVNVARNSGASDKQIEFCHNLTYKSLSEEERRYIAERYYRELREESTAADRGIERAEA